MALMDWPDPDDGKSPLAESREMAFSGDTKLCAKRHRRG